MNILDLLALTIIGQCSDRRFSCAAQGSPVPDTLGTTRDDLNDAMRAMQSARENA